MFDRLCRVLAASLIAVVLAAPAARAAGNTYNEEDIVSAAADFFGETTEGLARIIEKVFADLGRPNAFIAGEEVSGAIGIGVRYGRGRLQYKAGGSREIYWNGPSVGFDFGGNASKVFVLVYDLANTDQLFHRYPAVDGSIYLIAGVGANYHRSANVTLAPIRTGIGLRTGINIGYMHYTAERSWVPL